MDHIEHSEGVVKQVLDAFSWSWNGSRDPTPISARALGASRRRRHRPPHEAASESGEQDGYPDHHTFNRTGRPNVR